MKRGFTLIEVTIVMAILALIAAPFLDVYGNTYESLHALAVQADVRTEAQGAAARAFRLVAADKTARPQMDNHGIEGSGGRKVMWEPRTHRLLLWQQGRARPLICPRLSDFTVVRRDGVWTINMETAARLHTRGPQVTLHFTFDYPRLGALP